MKMNFIRVPGLLAAAAWGLATTAVFAAAPLINATLEPRQVSVGDSAQLTITSSGTGMEPISLPQVSGLEFRIVAQSRRIESINGATLATTSIVVRVTPQTAGTFTIPGFTPKSQPLVLRATPDNGSGNPSPTGGSNFSGQASPLPGGSAGGLRMTADGSAFVRMNLPKRPVYVGESIPVDIEVGMRAGFVTSLNGLPTLTGSEFTLNNLSHQPERAEKLIDGKPFTLLTWHSILAPVKPGMFSFAVQTPLTVRIRTRPAKDSIIDDLLGDPFLQNFFGATIPKDITVSSPPADLTVLALPTEGRPPDFSGAVGSFRIASELSSPTAVTGDPLTLRMRVSGAGNFDRVDSSMLAHLEHWKTYPPKSFFKPADAVGFKGEKTFEQPLIASRAGPQILPGLAFSYFDPNTHHYETARSGPLKVALSPSLADSAQAAPPTAAAIAAPSPTQNGLRPDRAVTPSSVDSLVPLYMQPRFIAVPSLLALAFAAGWLGLRQRARAGDPTARRGRLSKAAESVFRQMQHAADVRDAARFLNAARAGLQQALAARWQLQPDCITADELERRLGSDAQDQALRRIFTLTDEVNYSGHVTTPIDYESWSQLVHEQFASDLRT